MARNKKTKKPRATISKDSGQAEPKSGSARLQSREARREKARARSRVNQQQRLLLFGALAITALAYLNSLDGQFVYDDRLQILKNPTLNSLGNIPKMFVQSVWQFLNSGDQSAAGPYYRPFFNIALIVNHQLF